MAEKEDPIMDDLTIKNIPTQTKKEFMNFCKNKKGVTASAFLKMAINDILKQDREQPKAVKIWND